MNKKIRKLQVAIDKNNEKIDEIPREINRTKKVTRRRREKNQNYREISVRPNELKNMKYEIGNKKEALKQIISLIEEVKDQVKLNNKRKKQEN